MTTPEKNARHALDLAISRAATDRSFREALLRAPHDAIFGAFQVRIPNDYRIRFIEKGTDVDELIVLSDLAPADGALSESELESVAGGGDASFEWMPDSNTLLPPP